MSAVRQALQSALDEHGGLLPFDHFMQIALHHPEGGYYAARIRGIGPAGDFTTAPKLTATVARAVAGWLRTAAEGWGHIPVIECGPGDGTLAAGVLGQFGWLERRRLRFHLVETSAPLREKQRHTLRGFRAHWHENITEALAACEGRALIFHNEFFDAFPCRVFRHTAGGWKELHLAVLDSRLTERWLAPQRPLPDSTSMEGPWPEGQRVEVFASVRHWMESMSAAWVEGAMLAIDYGGDARSIYHRRPAGTLRAYRQHERIEGAGVFDAPGLMDITADVNFADLAAWAQKLGWRATLDQNLSEFLGPEMDTRLRDAGQTFHCMAFVTPGRTRAPAKSRLSVFQISPSSRRTQHRCVGGSVLLFPWMQPRLEPARFGVPSREG